MDYKQKRFEQMVNQNKGTIYTVCYMFSKDSDEVADLFQETLINLWKGMPEKDEISNICHVHHQGQFFQRVILFLVHMASFLPFRESKFVFAWPKRITRSEIYVLVKLQQES